jgi:hypothetical protein
VGLRDGLDTEATGKILFLCRGSNFDRPVVQPLDRHYSLSYPSSLALVLKKANNKSSKVKVTDYRYDQIIRNNKVLCMAYNIKHKGCGQAKVSLRF